MLVLDWFLGCGCCFVVVWLFVVVFVRLRCGWFISVYAVNLLLTCGFGRIVGDGFSGLVFVVLVLALVGLQWVLVWLLGVVWCCFLRVLLFGGAVLRWLCVLGWWFCDFGWCLFVVGLCACECSLVLVCEFWLFTWMVWVRLRVSWFWRTSCCVCLLWLQSVLGGLV